MAFAIATSSRASRRNVSSLWSLSCSITLNLAEETPKIRIRMLLEQHAELTASPIASDLLSQGAALAERFRIVIPHDLRRVGVRAPAAVLERVA